MVETLATADAGVPEQDPDDVITTACESAETSTKPDPATAMFCAVLVAGITLGAIDVSARMAKAPASK